MQTPPESPVVLQVLPSLVTGGVERGTIEVAQAIAEADGVALVASAGGSMAPMLEHVGGRHLTLPLNTKNPVKIWRNAARIEALIKAENVTLVHARSRAPAWSAYLACQRTGTPFVTTYHGTYAENLPFKRRYNSVMARGAIVIAASQFIADTVHRQHGVPWERLRVIPRGVDPAIFDPAAVVPDRLVRLAAKWRIPDGAPTVMLPGRLTSWKGHSVLLEAVTRLKRKDVCCVLVGSDQGRSTYSARLMKEATVLGLGDRVRLVGHCDDMPAAMMLSDVVVHASTRPEAFGRVVIEAQAMARPVIASDLGGPVETVEHGVTGWRVTPNDPDALAAWLDFVLSLSLEERKALGARARASVPTVRGMQDATLDVYEAVLGARN